MKKSRWLALLGLALLALALPAVALAQPSNDDFANATVVGLLPFSDTVDNTTATAELGEPQACYFSSQTVWYSFTPTSNGAIRADMGGSSFSDTNLNVYQQLGSGFSGLNFLGCASFGGSVALSVQAGRTYYLQAESIYSGGGSLHVNVQAVPPPPNDNFANATQISAVPFTDPLDLTAATVETGEPKPSCGFPLIGTAWYAFTPGVTQSYVGNLTSNTGFGFIVEYGVYTGNSLGALSEVACHLGNPIVFHANAGTTYYIQVANGSGQGNPAQFTLDVAPPPVAGFGFQPSDPSIFDAVQFFDQSFDPVGVGFQSESWNFGDGATATGCCPTHKYAADADYTVKLTVTTFDGRTASTSQVVHVNTHDVAITKFLVPTSASAGQTRTITVGVNSKRYPESVQVDLYKSTPSGFQLVGTLIQTVPVRPANRTTNFNFSYTFTSADATIGKVTFEAIATIIGARDALPADNTLIAPPTKVTK